MSCQFGIDENTTAIFTHDNLLVHLYLHLALCRDTVEAATTCITLHIHHAESVAGILADALERGEKACIYLCFVLLGLLAKFFFVLLGFRNDFFKFTLLFLKNVLLVVELCLCFFYLGIDLFFFCSKLTNLLLCKFHVQLFVFDFLLEEVVFTIVAHIVDLVVVALYKSV